MKISTEINSTALRFGEEKAVELVGKAGFDAWDLSMFPMCVLDKNGKVTPGNTHPFASKDYLKFVRRLKQIGLDNGIVCNQSHAPFPSTAAMQPYLMRAIECRDVSETASICKGVRGKDCYGKYVDVG